jgi:NitT/TauT family transport system permease protein
MSKKIVSRKGQVFWRLIFFAIILSAWEFLTRKNVIASIFLPNPSNVLERFGELLLSASFLSNHFFTSLFRVSAAFLVSIFLSFPLSILIAEIPVFRLFVEPIFSFMRYIPISALVPLCILWFGIDTGQKIAVIVLGVFFQLTLLFSTDIDDTPLEFIESASTLGLSRWRIICTVIIPYAMPAIWDDMRISAGWAWSYLILAELVAGNKGIGYFIINSQRFLELDKVFSAVIIVGILGALTDMVFRKISEVLFQWK